MKDHRKLWIGLLVLAVLSPLGLYLPSLFRAHGAWGETGGTNFWTGVLPGYQLRGSENAPLHRQSLNYIVSSLLGMVACAGSGYALTKLLRKKRRS